MKQTMVTLLFVVVLSAFLCGGCARQERALFNGKNLQGWKLFIPDENVDVNTVWSVNDGVIRCEGKPFGYMRTIEDHENYKLHLEWRWVEKPSNSGVLLHMSEPDKVWPKSIEAQLMSGNAGDFYLIGGTSVKERGEGTRVPKKHESNERPIGQWNEYDIFCDGDTIEVFINGLLQNRGTEATATSGKICLQSEGAPIEFRNIYIESL